MATLEKELKKRSKRLKNAAKLYNKQIDEAGKDGWIFKKEDAKVIIKTLLAASKGQLPKLSKAGASRLYQVSLLIQGCRKVRFR